MCRAASTRGLTAGCSCTAHRITQHKDHRTPTLWASAQTGGGPICTKAKERQALLQGLGGTSGTALARLGFGRICQKGPTSLHLCQGYFCTKHQVHLQTAQGWSAQLSFDGRWIACSWLVTQSSLWFRGEAPCKQLRLWTASQLFFH